jgi:hypothetical protein
MGAYERDSADAPNLAGGVPRVAGVTLQGRISMHHRMA